MRSDDEEKELQRILNYTRYGLKMTDDELQRSFKADVALGIFVAVFIAAALFVVDNFTR